MGDSHTLHHHRSHLFVVFSQSIISPDCVIGLKIDCENTTKKLQDVYSVDGIRTNRPHTIETEDIGTFASRLWRFRVGYIPREANGVADALTRTSPGIYTPLNQNQLTYEDYVNYQDVDDALFEDEMGVGRIGKPK